MEINLSQEEVTKLREIKERTEKLIVDLGDVSIQKTRLELLEESLKEELKRIITDEQVISQEFLTKYGAISVNIEKGTAFKIDQ